MIILLLVASYPDFPNWRDQEDVLVGMWSYGSGWDAEEWKHPDDETTCSLTSDTLKAGRESYRVRLSFGTRTEVVFQTSLDVQIVETFSLDFDDGAGLDMWAPQITKGDQTTFVANSISDAMFKKVIDDMRNTNSAS